MDIYGHVIRYVQQAENLAFFEKLAYTLGILVLITIFVKSLKIWAPESCSDHIMFASFVTLILSRDPSLVSYLTRFLTREIVWEHEQHVPGICDCPTCVLVAQKKCCFELPFLRYFMCFTTCYYAGGLSIPNLKEFLTKRGLLCFCVGSQFWIN